MERLIVKTRFALSPFAIKSWNILSNISRRELQRNSKTIDVTCESRETCFDNTFRQENGRVINGAIKRAILYTSARRPTALFIIPCLTALFMDSGGKRGIVNATMKCRLMVGNDPRATLRGVAIYGLFIWRRIPRGISTTEPRATGLKLPKDHRCFLAKDISTSLSNPLNVPLANLDRSLPRRRVRDKNRARARANRLLARSPNDSLDLTPIGFW